MLPHVPGGPALDAVLVPPADSEAVAKLLRCSIRWAEILTKDAREAKRAAEDVAIQRGTAEGKSEREIAEELGIPKSTVHDCARKTHSAETGHPRYYEGRRVFTVAELWQAEQQRGSDPYADARVSQSPTGQRWHHALEALRTINAQAPVSEMFADRYTGMDHAIGPELRRAHAWINELHRRFFDV